MQIDGAGDLSRRALIGELRSVVDALDAPDAMTASADVLLVSRRPMKAPALHELGAIVDAVGAITAILRACTESLDVAAGATVPDYVPEEWCEGGDAA
jgi:hypothetical protein